MKINVKKIIAVIVLLGVIVLSMTVVTGAASDPENHVKTIQSLEEKEANVMKMTATSAAAATAVALIPGDSTTPVANKLADLTSYMVILLMVIILEKYLITLAGFAAFFILIPAACVLLISGICLNHRFCKILSAKLALFGLVLYCIIPFSMHVSDIITDTYETSVENTVTEAEELAAEINESTDSEGNIVKKALNKIKGGVAGIVERAEQVLFRFVEAIAVLMVTSCLIPIAILLFLLWFIRMLFGIQIELPKGLHRKISSQFRKIRSFNEKE